MKKTTAILTICTAAAAAFLAGCGSKVNDDTSAVSHVEDTRFDNAALMFDYEGRTYSSCEVELEFVLTDVADGGEQIQVVFDKCQYPFSGIDLGETYTGTLTSIKGGYAAMDGCYEYAIPFMDLWEDGSRHDDTFYLRFSFGSRDGNEFCTSEIGLLSDTLYMM